MFFGDERMITMDKGIFVVLEGRLPAGGDRVYNRPYPMRNQTEDGTTEVSTGRTLFHQLP
jgi:hypothetical protein